MSYNIAAFLMLLTFSVIVASIDTGINSLYAKLIAISIGGEAIGNYVIYNSSAFQITNLCLGFVEAGALVFLFFLDRKVSKVFFPLLILFGLNFLRIISSILFGYEFVFRVLFELSVFLLWLIFRNDFSLEFVNFGVLPTSRR